MANPTLKKIELLFTIYQQGGHSHLKWECLKEQLTDTLRFSMLELQTIQTVDNAVGNAGKTPVRAAIGF